MEKVQREGWWFIGEKANDSAEYYDMIKNTRGVDMFNLLYDAAHKFGSRVVGEKGASFRDGMVYGDQALEAAEYLDMRREQLEGFLASYNRSAVRRRVMEQYYEETEKEYQVRVEV